MPKMRGKTTSQRSQRLTVYNGENSAISPQTGRIEAYRCPGMRTSLLLVRAAQCLGGGAGRAGRGQVRGGAAPAHHRAGSRPVSARVFWPPAEAAQADYETLRAYLLEAGSLPAGLAAARFARRGLAGLIAWPAAQPDFRAEPVGAARPPWTPHPTPVSRRWRRLTSSCSTRLARWQRPAARSGMAGSGSRPSPLSAALSQPSPGRSLTRRQTPSRAHRGLHRNFRF
jgi:hypothetical protein